MLYSQIQADRVTALRTGDSRLVGVLKLVLSELAYAKVDYKKAGAAGDIGGDLPDEEVIRVLTKEAKKRRDGAEIYLKAGSVERADEERYELEVIERYLPEMMSEAEVAVEIAKIASETGLSGGRLIGAAMSKLRGRVEAGVVQKVVTQMDHG